MQVLGELFQTNRDWVVTIVRVVLGVVLFAHGAQKLLGWYAGQGFRNTLQAFNHLKVPASVAVVVIFAECFGGLGLIVGLLSRLAALGVLGTMVGAVVLVHYRYGLFMNWTGDKRAHGFEYHLLAIALALVVLVKGGGALSLDYAFYQHQLRGEVQVSQMPR
jgi:putative oxidoreductase